MAVKIKGVIGWDIIGTEFADMISRFSGDIDVEIDSPGGYVSDGISIFNALKLYDKGKVNIHVVGECSSIAAYIMLSGDTLRFEPNSVVVLHNPWNAVCGDYRTMQKAADTLDKFTRLYAKAFVDKGICSDKDIRSYMDNETYFVGAEDLKLLGEVIEREDTPDLSDVEKETKAQSAITHIRAWQNKSQSKDDIGKIAALINCNTTNIKSEEQIVPTCSTKGRKEKIMDLKELQANHSDLFEQVKAQGKEEEMSRVQSLMEFIDVDSETVIKAINEGKSIRDDVLYAKLTRAKLDKNEIQAMEDDNPDDVDPKEPIHEPEQPTKEEQEAAALKKEEEIVAEAIKYL